MTTEESKKLHSIIGNMVFAEYRDIKYNKMNEHMFDDIYDQTRHMPEVKIEIVDALRNSAMVNLDE